jgi:hypothetical protein
VQSVTSSVSKLVRSVGRAAAVAAVLALLVAVPATAKGAELYALRYGARGNVLAAYELGTLRPSGATIQLGRFGHAWSVSADRTRLVTAAGVRRPGEATAIRFVNLPQRVAGRRLILDGERRRVTATAWVSGRVLVVVAGGGATTVYSVDPKRSAVVGSVQIPGVLVSGERTAARLVLLLAPVDRIGPARVVVVDRALQVHTVMLERITAGTVVTGQGPERQVRIQRPGLTVSPSGLQLYLVGGGEPAAAVELRTLAVRYAPLRRPAAVQKSAAGSVRTAVALPDGRIVVSGSDHGSNRPVGVSLLDPRDWSTRMLASTATWVRVAGGRIFTRGTNGVGLRLLEPSGRSVELFSTGSPARVSVVGARALVTFFGSGRRAAIVELRTRRVVGHTVPAYPLLGSGQPITG